ncbi:MAG: FHA domain-containing protein [Thiohalomonadales bacterium]|nr:FHA domain-containing protein [Thiohalomonadales bacterium]
MAMLVQFNEDEAGIRLPIDKQQIRIGRDTSNDISIDDDLVSKEHAILEVVMSPMEEGKLEYYLQDLNSTNHTYVNDERISLYKLKHGDIIRVGMNNFKFLDEITGDLDETAKLHKTWFPGVYYTKNKKKNKKKK